MCREDGEVQIDVHEYKKSRPTVEVISMIPSHVSVDVGVAWTL